VDGCFDLHQQLYGSEVNNDRQDQVRANKALYAISRAKLHGLAYMPMPKELNMAVGGCCENFGVEEMLFELQLRRSSKKIAYGWLLRAQGQNH
jgi:hypothetical protein